MFKVLIVDDERHIRNGIMSLIDWKKIKCEVVNSCANGLEAIEYLNNNEIDIIVTDIKMPGMNGLEVAEYIKINKVKTKVILLTAYADFTSAQLALKHNVFEYVVKTEFIDELPSSIINVEKKILQERLMENNIKKLEKAVTENKEDLKNKFLTDIIQDNISDKEIIRCKLDEFDLNGRTYYVITYEIKFISKLNYDIGTDVNKTMSAVSNFISAVFKEHEYSILKINKNSGVIIVYINNKIIQTSDLVIDCKYVLNMVNQFMRCNIKFAISEKCQGIENLSKGYKQSLITLSKIYSSLSNISVYSPINEDSIVTKTFEEDLVLQNIQNFIKNGSTEETKKELIKLFDYFVFSNLSLEQAKVKMIILFSYCLKSYCNYNIEQQELNKKETIIYNEINDCKSLQSLLETSCPIVEYIIEISKNNENGKSVLVREVNKYIRNNYNKNISLNSISSYLHVNSSYLSRLYKRETGDTLIDALNRHRIDIAKKLLKQPSSKISEVGIEVGIEDPAYFTHVFTKYIGCSPKEFKSK